MAKRRPDVDGNSSTSIALEDGIFEGGETVTLDGDGGGPAGLRQTWKDSATGEMIASPTLIGDDRLPDEPTTRKRL